jgi:hypothetical protein
MAQAVLTGSHPNSNFSTLQESSLEATPEKFLEKGLKSSDVESVGCL